MKEAMPVLPVDFVPEVGAYKQRIEKELRTMRPRQEYQASVGPYAIPNKLPADLQEYLEDTRTSSSSQRSRSSRRSDSEMSAKLALLEKQVLEEREGRKAVEAQLDRLHVLLQKLSADKGRNV